MGCLEASGYEDGKYDAGWVDFLSHVENTYNCAGFCKVNSFFSFTNIEDGPPVRSCYPYIIDEFGSIWGSIGLYGFFFMLAGALMFLAWYLSFGFCCRKYEADMSIFKSKIEYF